MEYLISVANIMYLAAFLVRDILWLRVLTVFGAGFLVPYFYFRPEPMMAAIYWNLLFTGLNLYWIIRLLIERRPVKLTGHDLRLYQLVFRCLTPREMLQLLARGRWECAEPGSCFISEGEPLDRLSVICAGRARVVHDGQTVDELADGQFIGGVEFLTEGAAPANVVALEKTYYMSWPKKALKAFLEEKSELNSALQLSVGFDIAQRLEASYGA